MSQSMPAPKGNKNGLKLKSLDVRQDAFHRYCEWIAKGKSSRSFTFVEGDLMCTGKTMESYIKENSIEFPPIHIEIAKAKGYAYWEQIVEDSASGANQHANTASLQMIMRNKFDWDKEQKVQTVDEEAWQRLRDFFSQPPFSDPFSKPAQPLES